MKTRTFQIVTWGDRFSLQEKQSVLGLFSFWNPYKRIYSTVEEAREAIEEITRSEGEYGRVIDTVVR